ncbi:MAG: oxidoreductase [Candidatus Heimdallarchaeaceae archaeon]
MTKLFTPFKIGNLIIRNRFVRSATTSYWSDDEGILSDQIIQHYKALAEGGIGLIIKGHSYINDKGKAHSKQSGLSSKKHVPRMKELTDIVHSFGSKIIAQINHGGYTAKADRATASSYSLDKLEARELSLEEISSIVEDFAQAAENAVEAGFDGIQIHAAHGYLVSQFLSDIVNKRQDKYGGSIEKRAQLLLEIYDAIRKRIGSEAIIGVKMNCDDFVEERGLIIADSTRVAVMLEERGIDFIEISGGGPEQDREIRKNRGRAEEDKGYSEATWGKHAEKFRESVPNLPLILVDGIRSRTTMDALLENNVVDFISMSKPFIIEPDLVKLLEKGQDKTSCIDCGECISREIFAKMMLRCHHLFP